MALQSPSHKVPSPFECGLNLTDTTTMNTICEINVTKLTTMAAITPSSHLGYSASVRRYAVFSQRTNHQLSTWPEIDGISFFNRAGSLVTLVDQVSPVTLQRPEETCRSHKKVGVKAPFRQDPYFPISILDFRKKRLTTRTPLITP